MTEPLPKGAHDPARAADITADSAAPAGSTHLPALVEIELREPPPSELERGHGHAPPPAHPLSVRQRRFVEEYLVDCNASAAARRAGYSERAAYDAARRLLASPDVKAAIREAMDDRSYRLKLSADRVLLELARLAFSDIGRIIDWSGDALVVEPPGRLSPDDRAAISEIAVIPGDGPRKFAVKVKMHDKQTALRLLARHLRIVGPQAIQHVASPSAAAARARELIRERLLKLGQGRDARNAAALGRI